MVKITTHFCQCKSTHLVSNKEYSPLLPCSLVPVPVLRDQSRKSGGGSGGAEGRDRSCLGTWQCPDGWSRRETRRETRGETRRETRRVTRWETRRETRWVTRWVTAVRLVSCEVRVVERGGEERWSRWRKGRGWRGMELLGLGPASGGETRRGRGAVEKKEREERRETSFAVENSFNTSTDDILTFPRRLTFPGVVGVL